MTALGRELLERCVDLGWLDPAHERDARFLAVVADELAALRPQIATNALALPLEPRARRAAERALAASPGSLVSAAELANEVGWCARTLERIFARETGLGVIAWQRRYRLLCAAVALGCGVDVTTAGFDAGYAGTSAFITAYRRAFGATPGLRSSGAKSLG
jgi:AraC-like DNA-binding protein